ncbi:MAG: aminoglycoside phosphotransferase family protein [Gaiellales bacterium]
MDVGADLKWTDPEWLADTHDWVIESLDRLDLTLMGPIEQPRVRPWATLLRAPSSEGPVWCKGMIDAVAHEPVAISILARAAPDRLPRLLAADRARGLMLTADGGTRLRDLEVPRRNPKRWMEMLRAYARLQRAAEGAAGELVAAGVPDRRLAVMPGQVSALVEQLEPPGAGELVPRLTAACAELAALGIPETIEHSDLHDAQVFAAPDGDRFFDWGDSSVAHPFLSLTVSLRVLASTVGVADQSDTVDTAIDAYLERWSALAALADLRRGAALGRALGGASRALTWHAIGSAAPATRRMFPNVATEWLEDTAQALA